MKKNYSILKLLSALSFLLFLGISPHIQAHLKEQVQKVDRQITGKVTDESGAVLPGTSVSIKGTSKGTNTDASGKYLINVTDNSITLVFSFTGYSSQEIVVGNRSVMIFK